LRKAIGLIELIFTMVIVAFVFTTIPKIIDVSNKILTFSKKEDAIFNMMAKAIDISTKEYDEENTQYDDILLVNDPPKNVLDCNASSWYRIGGFIGGRNCKDGVFESDIGADANEPPYDDVDDYNNTQESITSGHTTYLLKMYAGYTKEWNSSDYTNSSLDFAFSSVSDNTHTNVKRVLIEIYNDNKRIGSLKYYSANIGHIKIKSEQW